MKSIARSLGLLLITLCATTGVARASTASSAGVEYHSEYFWRGMSFYGLANAPRGVIFPWVSQSLGGFSLTMSGEIASAFLDGSASDTEKAWLGVDFIGSYNTTVLDGALGLGGRVAYFLYPNSPSINPGGWRNDFFDLAVWAGLPQLPLRPKLSYSHYLRIDDRGGTQQNLMDIYLKLSFAEEIALGERTSLTPGGWIGYFFYPSSQQWNDPAVGGHGDDYRGLSDIVVYAKLTTRTNSGLTLFASANLGVAPDQDLYAAWGEPDGVHVWAAFGGSFSKPWELGR